MQYRYMFTLSSTLSTDPDAAVQVAGGVRLKYDYPSDAGPGNAFTKALLYARAWYPGWRDLEKALREAASRQDRDRAINAAGFSAADLAANLARPEFAEVLATQNGGVPISPLAEVRNAHAANAVIPDDVVRTFLAAVAQPTLKPAKRLELTLPANGVAPRPALWGGLFGKIMSGWDWVVVRDDAVATFDARVTFQTDPVENGANTVVAKIPIDGIYRGTVDLGSRPNTFDDFREGRNSPGSLKFGLSIEFEAPSWQPKEDWAKRARSKYSEHYESFSRMYSRLVRRRFAATGKVLVGGTKYWPATNIEIDIYEIDFSN